MLLQGQGNRFQHKSERGQLDAGAGIGGGTFFAKAFELGDVGIVEIGEMRNRGCRADHVGRNRFADFAHGLAADDAVIVALVLAGSCRC